MVVFGRNAINSIESMPGERKDLIFGFLGNHFEKYCALSAKRATQLIS